MTARPMKCLLCAATCADKFSRPALGWDWFTGYMTETAHFCPVCCKQHASLLRMLRAKAYVRPSAPVLRYPTRELLTMTIRGTKDHATQ